MKPWNSDDWTCFLLSIILAVLAIALVVIVFK